MLKENKEYVVPTGIYGLRMYTAADHSVPGVKFGHGGFYRKSLTLFVGTDGVGRNDILPALAEYADFMEDYRVLYITVSTAEEFVYWRIYNAKEPTNPGDNMECAWNKECTERGTLFVRRVDTGITASGLEEIVLETRPDFVIVDGMELMENITVERIKKMAMDKRFAAVVYLPHCVGVGDMELSSVPRECSVWADLVITVVQDDILKGESLYHHAILKNEFGPCAVFMTMMHEDAGLVDVDEATLKRYFKERRDSEVIHVRPRAAV